jgi:hypothetical protein
VAEEDLVAVETKTADMRKRMEERVKEDAKKNSNPIEL